MKDTNNELPDYEGTWTGVWNNKTFYISFKRISNKYDSHFKYSKDLLSGKFKVVNSDYNILFDNTIVSDDNAKINGGKFVKDKFEYSFSYYDKDLCRTRGYITISFTDSSKTQLQWKYTPSRVTIFQDCFFYNYPVSQYPDPLPKNVILTKQ